MDITLPQLHSRLRFNQSPGFKNIHEHMRSIYLMVAWLKTTLGLDLVIFISHKATRSQARLFGYFGVENQKEPPPGSCRRLPTPSSRMRCPVLTTHAVTARLRTQESLSHQKRVRQQKENMFRSCYVVKTSYSCPHVQPAEQLHDDSSPFPRPPFFRPHLTGPRLTEPLGFGLFASPRLG